ncbi:hypothetical protein AXF42_Ash018637 [Apostasia shenzhenica]|uniref:Uncharacterized protein n=1 Tax=Apostasia shenzhenica TaxID=1088818 RepID=A0A2I0B1I6_9ASPA|nr:hypothetical protein AXF42_Ash018637 [Apostasia shenzhenica]
MGAKLPIVEKLSPRKGSILTSKHDRLPKTLKIATPQYLPDKDGDERWKSYLLEKRS